MYNNGNNTMYSAIYKIKQRNVFLHYQNCSSSEQLQLSFPFIPNPLDGRTSDVILKTGLGLKHFFEVLVLAKTVLVLTLDGLKDLKNCDLKTKRY